MRTLILLLLFLLLPTVALANRYFIVEKPDSTIATVLYRDGSSDSLLDVLTDMGLNGYPIQAITKAELDTTAHVARKYRRFNPIPIGGKLIIDQAAIDADQVLADEVEAKANAALQKMCPQCTREEFRDLMRAERGKP